ncbi:MAG: hypothetical protein KKF44_00095 [Nanoarchaeota archaeon]|nr:hypothetical protein [Nanoarchaeota archaeon]
MDDFQKLMDYQNMLSKSLAKEQAIDKKVDLLNIINQLTAGPNNLVQKEHILLEAEQHGFSEDEIEMILIALIKDNIIFESSPGFIKKK